MGYIRNDFELPREGGWCQHYKRKSGHLRLLYGDCRVELQEGSFRRDNQQLSLWQRRTHLPNPIDTGTAMLAYSVWARATRARSALMASCFTNQTSGDTFSKIGALVVSLSELNLRAPAGLVIGSSLYRL